MRPKQWIKNGFVSVPLIFDVKLFDPLYLGRTIAGFFLLCFISGTVYIINDLVDADKDRQHPKKQHRPIASGQLPRGIALVAAIVIPLTMLPLSFLLHPGFGAILVGYLALQIAYSLWLKNIVIVDALVVASGFVLRVAAGVYLVNAERFSPWMYVFTTLLALVMAFGKRRHELVLLKENADAHRNSLQEYNLPLLDQITGIVTSATILTYALYTFSAEGLPPNHTMMLTIPFVLYGIFRYLYLIHVKEMGGAPTEIALSDRPLQVTIILWGLSIIVVMYVLPRI